MITYLFYNGKWPRIVAVPYQNFCKAVVSCAAICYYEFMDDKSIDRYIKALTAFGLELNDFLLSIQRVIRVARFTNALIDTLLICKCSVILFANYDSQERQGTAKDVRGTRTDRNGGWQRGQ